MWQASDKLTFYLLGNLFPHLIAEIFSGVRSLVAKLAIEHLVVFYISHFSAGDGAYLIYTTSESENTCVCVQEREEEYNTWLPFPGSEGERSPAASS